MLLIILRSNLAYLFVPLYSLNRHVFSQVYGFHKNRELDIEANFPHLPQNIQLGLDHPPDDVICRVLCQEVLNVDGILLANAVCAIFSLEI